MLRLIKKRRRRNAQPLVVGLEFQKEGIAAVVNHGPDGSFECLFVPAKGEDRLERLTEMVKEHRLHNRVAVVSMASHEYSLLQMRSPAMSQDELRASMKWRVKELVDYPTEETVVDVFELPESGQRGAERLLYVVATQATRVQRNVDMIKKSGLDLKAIDIGELSLRNVMHRISDQDSGAVVLFLSQRSGLLVFVKGDELYLARRLEVGVDHYLTSNVEQKNQISEQIFLEVQRSLDYFEGHFSQPLPGKLFVFPGLDAVQPLIDQVKENLSLTVEGVLLEDTLLGFNDLNEEHQSRCVLAAGASLRSIAKVQP